MERFNVIVCGSRSFAVYSMLSQTLEEVFAPKNPTAIICGEAEGADTLGRQYAEEHYIPVQSFPANWEKYGRQAGFIRNNEMLKHADAVVAFWNGKSNGTRHMIDIARKAGIPVRVVRI